MRPSSTAHCSGFLRQVLALFVGSVGLGCAAEGTPSAHIVRDSAGVRIVESARPAWPEAAPWSISADPLLEIGTRDGNEAVQLFQVSDAARMHDGRILVANEGTGSVKVFAPAGTLDTELGRSGDGPGELRSIASIHALPGDTVLVWDLVRTTASLFTPDGGFVRTVRIAPAGSERPLDVHPLPDGRLVVVTGGYSSESAPGIQRGVAPLLVVSADGSSTDTVSLFPSIETLTMTVGGMQLRGVVPFPKAMHLEVRDGTLVIGTAERMEVSVLDPSGTLLAVYRQPAADLIATEQDHAWYRERLAARASTPAEREMMDQVLAALVFPETHAAYSDLQVDPTGAIWLRTGRHFPPNGSSREWTVFSPEGALLGTLTLPERFEPLEFGDDYVLGVWSDELDVEFLRLYGLSRS